MIASDDGAVFAGVTWRAEARASLYGVCIGLRVTDDDHLPVLVRHMPHGAVAVDGQRVDRLYSALLQRNNEGPVFELFAGWRRIARRPELEHLARAFAASARHFVATRAEQRIFVHAGVVGWKDRAVVIPGRTLTGKTTLVAEFVRAGATYYSDEYAVLDEKGRVHPFAKPLSIRTAAGRPQELIEVENLGGRAGTRPLRIGTILSARYVPGTEWRPEPLSAGQAALALLDNAVAARSRFREVCQSISAALSGGVCTWQGLRSDARLVVRWTLERMSAAGV